jgi:hypothetical protein
MRSVIPGQVSTTYIEALRINQIEFLRSITASSETTERAREAWPPSGAPWRPKKANEGS